MRWIGGAFLLGVVVLAGVGVSPARYEFPPTVVPKGVAIASFTVSGTPRETLYLSFEGPHRAEFVLDTSSSVVCYDANWTPSSSCPVEVSFRPKSIGRKTATLVVANKRGERATAAVAGEGIAAVECQPLLVHCNYVKAYSGSIQVVSVDSTTLDDHKSRAEEDIHISIVKGVVTCSGLRREYELKSYKGEPESEMKATGAIAGTGMLAIEFERRSGQPVYLLTFACPVPRMTRTSTHLPTGNSETETFDGAPADWRNSMLLADPQPAQEPGMTPLQGRHTNTRWDRENRAGGITKVMWELTRP